MVDFLVAAARADPAVVDFPVAAARAVPAAVDFPVVADCPGAVEIVPAVVDCQAGAGSQVAAATGPVVVVIVGPGGNRPGAGGGGEQWKPGGGGNWNGNRPGGGGNWNGNRPGGGGNWNGNRPGGGNWANNGNWNHNNNNFINNNVNNINGGGGWHNGNWNNGVWHNGNWYHGNWNGNWGNNWGYSPWGGGGWGYGGLGWGYGAGLATAGLVGLASPWSWGYYGYSNPYYSATVASNSYYYDYSQPLVASDQSLGTPRRLRSIPRRLPSIRRCRPPARLRPIVPPPPASPATAPFDAAREAFQQGDYQTALDQADQAIKASPSDPDLHQFRALCLFALGKYKERAATLYSVLANGPGWDWTTLSSFYPATPVYTERTAGVEAYSQKNPDSADARFNLAYQYLVTGHNPQAIEERADPDQAAAERPAGQPDSSGSQCAGRWGSQFHAQHSAGGTGDAHGTGRSGHGGGQLRRRTGPTARSLPCSWARTTSSAGSTASRARTRKCPAPIRWRTTT